MSRDDQSHFVTELKRSHRFVQLALVAVDEALKDAQWFPQSETDLQNTGKFLEIGVARENAHEQPT
jgi:3-oxoacyl-(acyl-carrier-protein) synthase